MNDAALQSITLLAETHLNGMQLSCIQWTECHGECGSSQPNKCASKKVMHEPKSSAWFGWGRERVSERRGFQGQLA